MEAFEQWLKGEAPPQDAYPKERAQLLARLPQLRGKGLGCWCAENVPCHGDVLLRMANAASV